MPVNQLRALRRKAGFRTQRDLAERLKIGKSTIANMECGYRPVPVWYRWLLELAAKDVARSKETD